MSKIKNLLEDKREARFQELCEKWMDVAWEYGMHPDDDCDWVQEMAAEEQHEEEQEAYYRQRFGNAPALYGKEHHTLEERAEMQRLKRQS